MQPADTRSLRHGAYQHISADVISEREKDWEIYAADGEPGEVCDLRVSAAEGG